MHRSPMLFACQFNDQELAVRLNPMTPESIPAEDFAIKAIQVLCDEDQEACIQRFPELKDHPELLKAILLTEEGISYCEGRTLTIKKKADELGLRLKQILAADPEASR